MTELPNTVSAIAPLEDTLLQLCKAGGDALRLQVLRVLSRDAYTVQELCHILDSRQSGLSHHLKILLSAGLVTKRREGNSLFYRRTYRATHPQLTALQQQLLSSIDQLALSPELEARLEQVIDERSARSQAFFAQYAGQFQAQQEQMVAFEVYGQSTAELLANSQPQGGELAVEVGPGDGAFLTELAKRYQRVVAIDNSAAMLDKAKQTVIQQGLDNVRCQLDSADIAAASADCVVANMVLHHVPSPVDIFREAASWLKPGGLLCVTELCRHDQNWAREACGDLWLGFEPDDLSEWATASGFSDGPAVYLAQLNGFRVQVRQFINTAA